jgi:enamine deaminase RidA (YjgF/YER057c/UK114 family)
MMARKTLNPPGLFPSRQYGFSQGVMVGPGRTIYLSGQVAWDRHQRIVGPGDLAVQVRQALENVETGLKAAGATLADVLLLRIYVLADRMGESSAISQALLKTFPADGLPATTWIGVQSLARQEFLVEIEAIAYLE